MNTKRLYMRLREVSVDIDTLEEHLDLIEANLEGSIKLAELQLKSEIQGVTPHDEDKWDIPHQLHDYKVEITLPRILRNPFLVSLFAVYESTVTEIADFIREEKGLKLRLGDIRRSGFLDQAQLYYKHILQFELSTDNERWKRLKILSVLRNAIAHTNGRWDAIKEKDRCRLMRQEGVKEDLGFVVVSECFLRETVRVVKDDLQDLLARFEKWETAKSP